MAGLGSATIDDRLVSVGCGNTGYALLRSWLASRRMRSKGGPRPLRARAPLLLCPSLVTCRRSSDGSLCFETWSPAKNRRALADCSGRVGEGPDHASPSQQGNQFSSDIKSLLGEAAIGWNSLAKAESCRPLTKSGQPLQRRLYASDQRLRTTKAALIDQRALSARERDQSLTIEGRGTAI